MTSKEQYLRLLAINVLLSFYTMEECTKTIHQLKRKVKREIRRLSKTFKNTKEAIKYAERLYPAWEYLHDNHAGKKYNLSLAIVGMWEVGVPVSFKLIETYAANDDISNSELDNNSYMLTDTLKQRIKEILNDD